MLKKTHLWPKPRILPDVMIPTQITWELWVQLQPQMLARTKMMQCPPFLYTIYTINPAHLALWWGHSARRDLSEPGLPSRGSTGFEETTS